MNRNEEDIKYVEVRDSTEAEWRRGIYVDDFENGSCLCVNSSYEMNYKNNMYYFFTLWSYWREIKDTEYVPFDFNDDVVGKIVISEKGKAKRLITEQYDGGVYISNGFIEYNHLLRDYTINGQPAGKLKGGVE